MKEFKKIDADFEESKEDIDLEEQERKNKEREEEKKLQYFKENEINLRVSAGGEDCFVIVELPDNNPEYVVLKNIKEENDIRTMSRDTLYSLNPDVKEKMIESIFRNVEDIEKAENVKELSELVSDRWGKLNELLFNEDKKGQDFIMDVMNVLRRIKYCLDDGGKYEDIQYEKTFFISPKKGSDFYSPKQLSNYIVALKNKVAELLGDQGQKDKNKEKTGEKKDDVEEREVKNLFNNVSELHEKLIGLAGLHNTPEEAEKFEKEHEKAIELLNKKIKELIDTKKAGITAVVGTMGWDALKEGDIILRYNDDLKSDDVMMFREKKEDKYYFTRAGSRKWGPSVAFKFGNPLDKLKFIKEKTGEKKDDAVVDKAEIENKLGEWKKNGTLLRIEEGGEEKYILTVCTPGAEIEWVWVGTKEGKEGERLKKEEIYKLNVKEKAKTDEKEKMGTKKQFKETKADWVNHEVGCVIPSGEHRIIGEATDSSITIESGAKLTIKNAKENRITIQTGGELEILGKNLDNKIIDLNVKEKPKKEENKEMAVWVNIRNSYRNKSKDIENRYKKASVEDKKKIENYLKSDVLDSSVFEKYGMDLNEENKKKALEIQKEIFQELLDKLKPNQIPIPRPEPEKPERKEAPRTLDEIFDKLGEDGEKLREILARFEKNLKIDNERFAEIATSEDVKRIEKKIEDSEPLTREEIGIMVKMERTKQTVFGDRINTSVAESTAFYLASGDKDIKGMLELRVLASESILRQYEEYFASRKKEEDFKWKENPEGAKAAKKLSKATGEKTKGFWGKIGEKLDVWTEAKIIPHEEWIEMGSKIDKVKNKKDLKEAIEFLREKVKDKKIPERFPEEVKDVLEKTQAIINSTDREEGIQWYLSAIEDGDIRNNNNFMEALKKDRELIRKVPRGACKNSLNKLLDKIEEIWKSKVGTDEKLDELEKITAEISGTGEAASKPEEKSRERQVAGTTTLYDWAMDKYRGARKTIAESSIARATGISKAIYKGDYESFKKKRGTVEEEKKAYRQAKTPKDRYNEILDGAWKGKSDTEFTAIMEVMIEKKELTIDEMSKHLSSEEIRSLEESISEALMKRGFAFDVDELKKSMPQLASQVELKPEDSQNEVDKKTAEYTKEIVSKGELSSLNRAAFEDPIVINTIRKEHDDFDAWVKGRSETDKQSIRRGLEGMLLILDGKIRAAGRGDITNITGSKDEKIVSVAGVEMTKNELLEEISNIKKSLANSDKNGHNMLNKPATDSSGEIALNKEGRIDFENGTINEKARKEFAESMKSGKDTYRNRTVEFYEAMGRYFSKEQFNQVKKHCNVEQMKAAKKSALMAPAGSVAQEIFDFLETDSDYKFLKIERDVAVKEKKDNLKIFKEKESNIEKVVDSYNTSKWTQQTFNEFMGVANEINKNISEAFGDVDSDYLATFLTICNGIVIPLFREARDGKKIDVAEELEKMENGYKNQAERLTKTKRGLPPKIKEFYKAYFNKLNELVDLKK